MILYFSIFYFLFSGIVTFESFKGSELFQERSKKTYFMLSFICGWIALPILIGRNLK